MTFLLLKVEVYYQPLSYISDTYYHYYKLLDNGIGPNVTSFALEALAERAENYGKSMDMCHVFLSMGLTC